MSLMRLDKYLAAVNLGTRTEVKKFIKNGRIKINDKLASDPAAKIDSERDEITCDGSRLIYEQYRYYMLYKPQDCVSATKDKLSDTVIGFLSDEITEDLFPVGRLDKDTEGLLLITNDGKLAHDLLSPKKHVDKTYLATVTGKLSEKDLVNFMEGLDIGDDKKTLPAKIRLVDEKPVDEKPVDEESENNEPLNEDLVNKELVNKAPTYEVVIHEGRYHQIKRMFEALGVKVTYLKRIAMGPVLLDEELAPGEYRRLTSEELEILKNR